MRGEAQRLDRSTVPSKSRQDARRVIVQRTHESLSRAICAVTQYPEYRSSATQSANGSVDFVTLLNDLERGVLGAILRM